ncbi:MAG: hypothetical protein E7231_04215 [Cellulosilyticum sp.]|nr:hypothetical protein [Cellulosilyticum sp.]
MKEEMYQINLLPKRNLQIHRSLMIQRFSWGILGVEIGVFILGAIGLPYMRKMREQAQLRQVLVKLEEPAYSVINEKLKTLDRLEIEVEALETQYQDLSGAQFINKQLITQLLTSIADGLKIESIVISEEDSIRLDGSAEQATEILNYQTDLEKQFKGVKVKSEFAWDEENEQYPFVIELIKVDEDLSEMEIEEKEGEST